MSKDDAIFLLLIIVPIEKIVDDLFAKEPLQISFLEEKLNTYMRLAAQVVGVNPILIQENENKPTEMNEHCRQYYLNYFSKLLAFFKNME